MRSTVRHRRAALLLALLLPFAARGETPAAPAAPPESAACGAPAEFLTPDFALPAVAGALARGTLRILVVGAASVTGPGTTSPVKAYPFRLEALLGAGPPPLRVVVTVRGGRGLTATDGAALLTAETTGTHYDLVIWQTGTVEATRGLDVDEMVEALGTGFEALRTGGTDVVLMGPQFSRFLRANANIEPYLDGLRLVAAANSVPLFRRYGLMHAWADAERLDLERAARSERAVMTDHLHECLADALRVFILAGAALPRP